MKKTDSVFGLCYLFCGLTLWMSSGNVSSDTRESSPADRVYVHGIILTGEGLDSARAVRVSALAVRGDAIVATGTDTEVLKDWRGPKTEVVDLHGKFVMPGFNDAHVHLASAGLEKIRIDLLGCKSLEEMQR